MFNFFRTPKHTYVTGIECAGKTTYINEYLLKKDNEYCKLYPFAVPNYFTVDEQLPEKEFHTRLKILRHELNRNCKDDLHHWWSYFKRTDAVCEIDLTDIYVSCEHLKKFEISIKFIYIDLPTALERAKEKYAIKGLIIDSKKFEEYYAQGLDVFFSSLRFMDDWEIIDGTKNLKEPKELFSKFSLFDGDNCLSFAKWMAERKKEINLYIDNPLSC